MRTSAQAPGAKRHLVLAAQNDNITSNALAHTLTACTLSGVGLEYVHALASWEGDKYVWQPQAKKIGFCVESVFVSPQMANDCGFSHSVTVCRLIQGLTTPST